MSFFTSTLLLRAGPLAVLTLFAGLSIPHSTTGTKNAKPDVVLNAFLDIKPGSCPNPINVDQTADDLELIDGVMVSVLPVSVLGGKFDVEQIDLGSVSFSRTGIDGASVYPIRINYADTGTIFEGEGCECHALAGDGSLDLDLKFDKAEVIAAFGLEEEENGTFVELQITGLVKGEIQFVSSDCVRIINQ